MRVCVCVWVCVCILFYFILFISFLYLYSNAGGVEKTLMILFGKSFFTKTDI